MAEAERRKNRKRGVTRIKVGTWNVRGFGGRFARIDQALKAECIFSLMESRGWEVGMLSDLSFEMNGVREFRTSRQTWTLIIQGKVGIALNREWASDWREAGAKVWCLGEPENTETRVMAVGTDRVGWK